MDQLPSWNTDLDFMDNRAIGFFDSGLGGLTAVSALREFMPHENIIYFGDTGRMPYGSRERSQLRMMARQNLDFLASFNVKAILAACGTMSANATDILNANEIPVFNVLQPSVETMSKIPGSRPLAVIATEASIKSGAFQRELKKLCPEREIMGIPCRKFVLLCESGHIGPQDEELKEAVEEYLRPVREAGAAAILLGCTHYGIISQAISEYLGPEVKIISASECAAGSLRTYLEENNLTGGDGISEYYTSGSAEEFDFLAKQIIGPTYNGSAVHVEPMPTEV